MPASEPVRGAGTDVTLQTWPVVPHVWQLFAMPESGRSMDAAAAFLKGKLRADTERLAAE